MEPIDKILINSLDVAWIRHELLANNIANIETKSYLRKDINFEMEIDKILNSKEWNKSDIEIIRDKKKNIEAETSEITKNSLFYLSLIKIISLRNKLLEISAGGK